MELLWNIFLVLVGALFFWFSVVLLFGAPFLPTLKPRVDDALDMLNLKKGQTLLELGSGDGRILVAAAKRGYSSVGIELNPFMVAYSKIKTFKYRKRVTIKWGNFWSMEWPDTDGIFVFLLDRYMDRLDRKIKASYKKPLKLVSFAFEIPHKKATKKQSGLFLYHYDSLKKSRR